MTYQYEVTVFRIVKQAVTVTIETEREMEDQTDMCFLHDKAEQIAGGLSEDEWVDHEAGNIYSSRPQKITKAWEIISKLRKAGEKIER